MIIPIVITKQKINSLVFLIVIIPTKRFIGLSNTSNVNSGDQGL